MLASYKLRCDCIYLMDLQLIRTFLEIISAGSFLEAANRVYVSQSAVSLRVKRLEEELGQKLFNRSNVNPSVK